MLGLTFISTPSPLSAKQEKAEARETRLQMFVTEPVRDGNILISVAGTTSIDYNERKKAMSAKVDEIMRAFDSAK